MFEVEREERHSPLSLTRLFLSLLPPPSLSAPSSHTTVPLATARDHVLLQLRDTTTAHTQRTQPLVSIDAGDETLCSSSSANLPFPPSMHSRANPATSSRTTNTCFPISAPALRRRSAQTRPPIPAAASAPARHPLPTTPQTRAAARRPPPPRASAADDDMGALDDLKAGLTARRASSSSSGQQQPREKTAFGKRNATLEKYIPDVLENAIDALLPDALEAKMDRSAAQVEGAFFPFFLCFWLRRGGACF
jgi:hypothetical protein